MLIFGLKGSKELGQDSAEITLGWNESGKYTEDIYAHADPCAAKRLAQ